MLTEIINFVRYNLRYLGHPPWDTGISPPELLAFIQKKPPGRALDLGAGTGTNLATLANAGWEIEGVEFAPIAVLAARKKLKRQGYVANVYCRDVTMLEFLKHPFDLILDISCFHGLSRKSRLKYLENLNQILAKNGTFLLYGFYSQGDSELGVTEEEINYLDARYQRISRQMGLDAGIKESVWLEYKN